MTAWTTWLPVGKILLVLLIGGGGCSRSLQLGEQLLRADPIETKVTVDPAAVAATPTSSTTSAAPPTCLRPGVKSPVTWSPNTVPDSCHRTYLAAVALDSAKKCEDLLDRTGVATRGNDLFYDEMTTALNALATALTPLATVHALTAAATISSGSKTNFDSDLYSKQTASIIADQINSTYFKAIKDYADKLSETDDDKLIPAVEVLEIDVIHRQCNIDQALAALAAKARTPAPTATTACSQTKLTINDLPQAGQSKKIVAPANCVAYSVTTDKTGENITYTLGAGKPGQTIAIRDFLTIVNPSS